MSVVSESTDIRELEAAVEESGESERGNEEDGGRDVRHANVNADSELNGEDCGSVPREINTPGGKVGDRTRMYHPRFGR